MRLTKEQIDNVICNIENAGYENVQYNGTQKRFEFEIANQHVGISAFSIRPNLYEFRKQPSISLQGYVKDHNWFFV